MIQPICHKTRKKNYLYLPDYQSSNHINSLYHFYSNAAEEETAQADTPQTPQPLRSPHYQELLSLVHPALRSRQTHRRHLSHVNLHLKKMQRKNKRPRSADKKQSTKSESLDCRNRPKASVKTAQSPAPVLAGMALSS